MEPVECEECKTKEIWEVKRKAAHVLLYFLKSLPPGGDSFS